MNDHFDGLSSWRACAVAFTGNGPILAGWFGYKDNGLKYTSINRGFPAGNPIANIFVIIVGALAIGASIVLGFFAFIIVGSIVLIMASIIGLRVWWFKRQLRGHAPPSGQKGGAPADGVIEGEYRVVAEDSKDE